MSAPETIDSMKEVIKACGIVGAGGGGFPSHLKLDSRAHTILLNCAECEPLLQVDQQLLANYASEIVSALHRLADALGASAVVAVKKSYTAAISAVECEIEKLSGQTESRIRLALLDEIYPAGDEIVLIYEALGLVVPPGSLPIDVGCIVFNVETVYNMYHAFEHGTPVTHKWVTIVGEVERPVTALLPVGMPIAEAIKHAGQITVDNPAFILGGPMMGGLIYASKETIKKTTNAILVLPSDHSLILRNNYGQASDKTPAMVNLNRVASACCQCRTCTDMCPRNQLGHPIEPHRIMRALAARDTSSSAFGGTMYCSFCGVCETMACPQSLAPRSLIGTIRTALKESGVKPEKYEPGTVSCTRNGRLVGAKRLTMRLGLSKYDIEAPLISEVEHTRRK